MQCPKCKQEIEANTVKCQHCGARVGSVCKKCGTYNPITATECLKCKQVLIKICSECGSANRPDAKSCRKCGIEFVVPNKTTVINPTYYANLNSQQKAKAKLIEAIKDIDIRVITLSGESGSGKNIVLRTAISELKTGKITWLLGSCTQITQLSPFGFFQDLLLTFFNINNFCPDTLQLKKDSIKFFKEGFPSLTNNDILDLLNLLYPNNIDKYENIYYNKAKMFVIMKKIIMTILEKTKIIFLIDNFELIDGMSYDFIKELLKEDLVQEKSKFIILCTEPKPGQGLIQASFLKENNYTDISIAPFTPAQVETFIKQYNDFKFGKDFTNLAVKVSKGNPSIIEQIVLLYKDIRKYNLNTVTYNTLENILRLRLNILKAQDMPAYRILTALSVLGVKVYPAILEHFDNNTPAEFERIIEKLVQDGFLTQIDTCPFEFKTTEIWKTIVSIVKNDEQFEEILNQLYEILNLYKQSSIALVGYIVQKLNNNDQAFEIWTHLMKQSSAIGDISLYIISQRQALKLIENKNNDFYSKVKKNIYTRVGKLLEPIDHNAAFDYLQKAIMLIDDNEEYAHIELLGYLASCAMKSGNYCGAIECIDNVLNKIPEENKLEKILIKTRQITPMLRLGNYGQLINLIETEVLNDIERILSKGKDTKFVRIEELFKIWLDIYFDYAEALVFQGNNRAFDIIQNIYDILDKNQISEPQLLCRTNLLLALANTIKGDIKLSSKILDDILKEFSLDNMDSFIVSRWNFIDIMNKFFDKDFKTLHTELFNVAAYANNVNDNFTKNILKTILAKILKDSNQAKKALEILEEQVSYFAKEKVATGVLLSWYLIAEIKLITSGVQFALDIANKALDIAQSPNINNYYFITLFNKLIGEIYLAKQDFDSAKVYLEKALYIAKQFDLQYIQVNIYLLSAKLYQELALPKTSQRNTYVKQALKMFQLAKNIGIVADNQQLQRKIKEELNVLTSFCKLNGIVLKRG